MPKLTKMKVNEEGDIVRVNCPALGSELVQELLGIGCHSVAWTPDGVSFTLSKDDLDEFKTIYKRGGHVTLNLPFRILVYYDYISPFAYVATELVKSLEAEFRIYVEWRPFELRPRWYQYPDVTANPARSQARWTMQKETVQRWGLPIAEERPPFRLRTRSALMATEYAKEHGRFREFQRAMFNAYYVTNEDIRDLSVIARISEEMGLNREALIASVMERRYEQRIEQWRREAEADLIFGVPAFKIGSALIWGREPIADLQKALLASGASKRES